MKKLLVLLTYILSFSALEAQVSNSLTISGYVTQASTGWALQDYPVTVTGDNGLTNVVGLTNDNGWYNIIIENGSVTGPNQLFIVSVVDSCSNAILADTISNQQGTVDEAVVNFQVCANSAEGCQAYFIWNVSNNNPLRIVFMDDSYVESEATYFWDFGDNTTGLTANAEHNYAEAGSYQVCLTITTANCTDTYCYEVVVPGENTGNDCNPFFEFNVAGPNPNGVYEVAFFSVDVPPANEVQHVWIFEGFETQTSSNPQYAVTESGEYTMCHIVYGVNCSDTLCSTIIVGNNSGTCEANFAATISQFSPFQVNLANQSFTNNTEASYVWDFGDGSTATSFHAEHTFNQSGPYYICLTVSTSNCTNTYCETVYILGTSPQDYAIGGQVFAGANVADIGSVRLYRLDQTSLAVELIQTTPIDSGGFYYFENVEEGVYLIKAGLNVQSDYYNSYVPTYFGSQFYWLDAEPVVVNENGFSYNISLIYSNNPGGEGWVNGNIDDGPYRLSGVAGSSASLIADANVFVVNLSGNPQKHQLSTENGEFSFSDLAYGTYRLFADVPGMICVPVEFTLSGENPGFTIEIVMGDEILSVAEQQEILIGHVYPNPSNEVASVNLSLRAAQKIFSSLTTTSGQLVWQDSQQFTAGTQTIRVPLNQVAKGFYFLVLRDAQQKQIGVFKLSVIH